MHPRRRIYKAPACLNNANFLPFPSVSRLPAFWLHPLICTTLTNCPSNTVAWQRPRPGSVRLPVFSLSPPGYLNADKQNYRLYATIISWQTILTGTLVLLSNYFYVPNLFFLIPHNKYLYSQLSLKPLASTPFPPDSRYTAPLSLPWEQKPRWDGPSTSCCPLQPSHHSQDEV